MTQKLPHKLIVSLIFLILATEFYIAFLINNSLVCAMGGIVSAIMAIVSLFIDIEIVRKV